VSKSKGFFHDELDVRAYQKERWKLLHDYSYTTNILYSFPVKITVVKGFITDLASIPKIARSLIPQVGKHRGAAVIHDWLYSTSDHHTYSRLQCDRVFLEAMKTAGVSLWKRHTMFLAVRSGGWIFFNKRRKGANSTA
jgi:hypothetical protein